MNVTFWPTAWEDYRHWQEHDARMVEKLAGLTEECQRHACNGTCKLETLGGNLSA